MLTQIVGTGSYGAGGLKKVDDVPMPCVHPEHNPPTHIVLQPGVYEYTCPGCGRVVRFTVNGIVC